MCCGWGVKTAVVKTFPFVARLLSFYWRTFLENVKRQLSTQIDDDSVWYRLREKTLNKKEELTQLNQFQRDGVIQSLNDVDIITFRDFWLSSDIYPDGAGWSWLSVSGHLRANAWFG